MSDEVAVLALFDAITFALQSISCGQIVMLRNYLVR